MMQTKNYLFTLGLALGLGSLAGNAQTVSTFDDIALPGADTNFAQTQPVGPYSFQSGNAVFHGTIESWGGYAGFNVSNVTNTTDESFLNDKAAETGMGFDSSANYAVCFVTIDFMGPDPTATVPVGVGLRDSAAGNEIWGTYVTNTAYSYGYLRDFFHNGDWFKLVVRGYLNGAQVEDSVLFSLAEKENDSLVALKDWEWMDLSSLGAVDSLTFDLISSDTVGGFGMNNPAYFAIDNFTTGDGVDTTTPPTGIGNIAANLNFRISPNPTTDKIFIQNENPVDVALFDMQGRRLQTFRHTNEIDLSNLAPGMYLIHVWDVRQNKMGSARILKK